MMTTQGQDAGRQPFAVEVFTGGGAAAQRLRLQVARMAPHFRMALLTGERGVGKETVAREMHRLSPAGGRPFAVRPAAEFAQGDEAVEASSTLYMAGLEGLAAGLQERLLGRLHGLHRETRVLVGSECDLRGMMATGRLRADLHAKVATLEIRVAPLRERVEDLEQMLQGMLGRLGGQAAVDAAALERMRAYGWPGNLRELWSVAGELAEMQGAIGAEDLTMLDEGGVADEVGSMRLDEVMQRHVMDVLERCAGNKLKAAELLGISRSTLYRMLDSALL